MNVLLQKHGAKHIHKVPEGLRELCTDISREVLRSQPRNIYCFIADYVEALLITRENAKVAVRVVNNILLGSQAIVAILHRSGLSLEQIARAAPRIQKAFGAYLDATDMRAAQVCEDETCAREEKSEVSLREILRATGVTSERAEKAATIIQAAFRGHYERMLLHESQGMIQWQRAATRTLEILRKAGASRAEASKAAVLIQATYRGYYTRKNLQMKTMAAWPREKKEDEADPTELIETIQSVAWLDMMYEDSRPILMGVNEAASVIQKAYKRYRARKDAASVPREQSARSVVKNVIDNLHQRVFDDITPRADIPTEFGSRDDLVKASKEPLSGRSFTEQLMLARLIDEDGDEGEEFVYPENPRQILPVFPDDDATKDRRERRKIEAERDEGTGVEVA